MAGILDTLRDEVTAALTGALRPATYWQNTITGYDQFGSPIYEWTGYPCEGVRGSFDALYIASGQVPIDNAKVEIIASTLPVEARQQDMIHIEGAWWYVHRVELDPASAWWICQCSQGWDPTA